MVKCVTGTEAETDEVTGTGQMTETAETGPLADLTGQISHVYMSFDSDSAPMSPRPCRPYGPIMSSILSSIVHV